MRDSISLLEPAKAAPEPAEGTGAQTQGQSGFGEANGQEGRDGAVSRSEGGPGRGYYLNGVFYPYTDDEKDQ